MRANSFSLPVLTERPHPTRLFLKKSRTSLSCLIQSRSENAFIRLLPCLVGVGGLISPLFHEGAQNLWATPPRMRSDIRHTFSPKVDKIRCFADDRDLAFGYACAPPTM